MCKISTQDIFLGPEIVSLRSIVFGESEYLNAKNSGTLHLKNMVLFGKIARIQRIELELQWKILYSLLNAICLRSDITKLEISEQTRYSCSNFFLLSFVSWSISWKFRTAVGGVRFQHFPWTQDISLRSEIVLSITRYNLWRANIWILVKLVL